MFLVVYSVMLPTVLDVVSMVWLQVSSVEVHRASRCGCRSSANCHHCLASDGPVACMDGSQ